jgi:hypothetical protein
MPQPFPSHPFCGLVLVARSVMNFGKEYVRPSLRPALDSSDPVQEVSVFHDPAWYHRIRGNDFLDVFGRIWCVCFLKVNLRPLLPVAVDAADRFLEGIKDSPDKTGLAS